ncbi:MAG: PA14 domain-containing protein, partial [Algisphaera sp.]
MTCAPKETARPVVFEMLEPRVLLSATPTGEISRDYWTGIAGNYVSTLTNDAAYPDNPTGSDTLSTFESVDWNNPAINKDFADNYSERIRGYLVPVTTGDYTFWISGDNESQLWLSSDQGPANRVLIASTPIYTGQYEWDKAPSQQSTVIALVAGQKYFIEVLHAEGGSNDHLAVGWLKPGEVGTAPSEIIPG